jgi:8-oxo-dGTP pyrophosphatase MutT (NUDIX family)
MSNKWKIVGEKLYPKDDNLFGNRFYGYRSTKLKLPDGADAEYHGVVVGPCVHVVAVEEDSTTYLVRQSRPNARALGDDTIPETLELPGGFQEEGSDAESAAASELGEEIRRRAGSLVLLGVTYPSTGISNETDTIFLATDLSPISETGIVEATEQDLRVVAGKFGELYDLLRSGSQPVSAQTLAGMALAAAHL